MSMQLLTIMQFAGVLGIYVFLAIILPALVFYRKFKMEPFYVRFMVYITFGNFYIINLVFAAQLLHISNRFTLILGTVAVFLLAIKRVYRIRPLNSIQNIIRAIVRLLRGTMGIRLLTKRIRWYFGSIIKSLFKRMIKSIRYSWTEWICTFIVICLLLWMYGNNMVNAFGYSASDIPVHNYWINEMDKNNIFAAGIYPFGFHCVIYYIHTVFGIKTYILLRLFGVVQTIFIHLVLLAFLRACCKSKYIPYTATAIYICINLLSRTTYFRYISSLPQEFGMVFILPSIYFMYRFFEARKRETMLQQPAMADIGDVSDEVRKKYNYKDIKGKIIVEIEVFEKKDPVAGYENMEYPGDSWILEESEGIDGKAINDSLELCEEVKEVYKFYNDNPDIQSSRLFEDIASSIKMAEEERPWEKVLDEINEGRLLSGDSMADDNTEESRAQVPESKSRTTCFTSIKQFFKKTGTVKRKFNKIRDIESNLYLMLFALGFSMTLAIHFYDTMIAGIFCIGIAAGYCFRLFKKGYFGNVMLAGILSITVAVLPMALAFAGGKPLQGSLGWGMEIILGSRENGTGNNTTVQQNTGNSQNSNKETGSVQGNTGTNGQQVVTGTADSPSLVKRVFNKIGMLPVYFTNELEACVLTNATDTERNFILSLIPACIFLGLVLFTRKDKDYAARVVSAGVCTIILFIVLCSKDIGIPAIMDRVRTSIYIAYMLPVSAGMAADALIVLAFGWIKNQKVLYGASMAVSLASAVLIVQGGYVRQPVEVTPFETFETNDAITCLTNIMNENKNGTYTICSANDELRMVEGYGYHYETITFLRKMEGDKYLDNLTIPTNKVYFFIEKRPIGYASTYEDIGQYVSSEGASNPLVYSSGLGIYQGKNRWIVMSRMYYWAKEFQKMYGKEMKVYYESKDFVCYVVEQNPYRLYDFSIDYWYNTREWEYSQ